MTSLTTIFSEDKTGRLSKTLAYYAAFIALGMIAASLGPTLPELAEQTGTHLKEIGFLITVRSMGYLCGSLAAGRLYDRYMGHHLVIGAMIIVAVTFFIVPSLSLIWLLTGVFFIVGLGEAGMDVGGNTLLLWTHGDKVGPFMNGLHFFFGVGAFFAPIVVAQSLEITDGIQWAYWIFALAMLPLMFVFSRLPSPEIRHASETKATSETQTNNVLFGLSILFILLYVGVELGFGNWIYTYATRLDLMSKTTAAYLNSAFWGAFTVGRLLSVPVSMRYEPRTILLGSLIGTFFSLMMMLAIRETFMLWIGALGLGLSIAPIFATLISFVERRMALTGKMTSLFFVGAGAGAMVIPWGIGALMESQGAEIMLWLVTLDTLLLFGVYSLMRLFSPKPVISKVKNDGL